MDIEKIADKGSPGRVKLLFGLLSGSVRFFVISIICTAAVSVLEMTVPDIIRMTVDSVIGSEPLDLPGYISAVTGLFRLEPAEILEAFRSRLWLIVAYSVYFHSKIEKLFLLQDESEGRLSSIAQENLTGVRAVRAFGREGYEMERFS